jgi:hypothetical protein
MQSTEVFRKISDFLEKGHKFCQTRLSFLEASEMTPIDLTRSASGLVFSNASFSKVPQAAKFSKSFAVIKDSHRNLLLKFFRSVHVIMCCS